VPDRPLALPDRLGCESDLNGCTGSEWRRCLIAVEEKISIDTILHAPSDLPVVPIGRSLRR